jgi:hypothetical protein
MSDTVGGLGAVPDATYGQGRRSNNQNPPDGEEHPHGQPKREPADMRLIIEDDRAHGAVIYKTVDGRTGKVVQALEDEELQKLREGGDYVAGQVIKTRA